MSQEHGRGEFADAHSHAHRRISNRNWPVPQLGLLDEVLIAPVCQMQDLNMGREKAPDQLRLSGPWLQMRKNDRRQRNPRVCLQHHFLKAGPDDGAFRIGRVVGSQIAFELEAFWRPRRDQQPARRDAFAEQIERCFPMVKPRRKPPPHDLWDEQAPFRIHGNQFGDGQWRGYTPEYPLGFTALIRFGQFWAQNGMVCRETILFRFQHTMYPCKSNGYVIKGERQLPRLTTICSDYCQLTKLYIGIFWVWNWIWLHTNLSRSWFLCRRRAGKLKRYLSESAQPLDFRDRMNTHAPSSERGRPC